MLIPPLKPYRARKRYKAKASTAAPPQPVALTLVAASLDELLNLTLQFDRDIDVSAMDVTAIRVGVPATGYAFLGDGGPSLLDSVTVFLALMIGDPYAGPDVTLFASAASGIVAVDDGGTWAGTAGTVLPFP